MAVAGGASRGAVLAAFGAALLFGAAVAAGILLAWGGGAPGAIAALLVGAACLGWALDNHLTR